MANRNRNSTSDNSNSTLESTTMGHQATSTLETSDAPSDLVHPSENWRAENRPELEHREGEGGFQLAIHGKYNTLSEISLPDEPLRCSALSDEHQINTQARIIALQWNIRGLWGNYNDLKLEVTKHQPLVIALQETLFLGSDNRSLQLLKDYEWRFRADQLSRQRNVVSLAVRRDTSFSFLDLQTSLPVAAITMKHPVAATFVSLYLSPQITSSELESQLSQLLQELPGPVILMGDFNAHSAIWGSSVTDSKGIKIEDFLNTHNLSLLNNGDHTRLDPVSGKTSAIDLTIVSNQIASYGALMETPVEVITSPYSLAVLSKLPT